MLSDVHLVNRNSFYNQFGEKIETLYTKDFYLQVSLFVQASKDKKCQPHATDVEMLD